MPRFAGQQCWPATQQPTELVVHWLYPTPQSSTFLTHAPLWQVEVAAQVPQEPPQPSLPHTLPEQARTQGGGQAPMVAPLLISFFFFLAVA